MKAYNSDEHYHIHIDEVKEYLSLMSSPLETGLQNDSGGDLRKRFVLKYDRRSKRTDVSFVPPESSWEELREIHVTIHPDVHTRLGLQKSYVHRFGSAESIDLHLEEDISDYI
jgi:hypothetical protein